MSNQSGTFTLGDRTVKRLGYGAMQLAGRGVFGPPKDHGAALAVLREAVARGVNHIDTSDFYGPHVTNRLIREALAPYPDDLVIVTKIGARRGEDASWLPAFSPEALTQAVHDNLRNLGLDVLEVVNLRIMIDPHGPAEGSIEAPLAVLAELQRQGLVRHIGLSNATRAQVAQARRIAPDRRACPRPHRLCAVLSDGRFQAAAVVRLVRRRRPSRRNADAGRARLAASPLAQHPSDPRHLIGRAPSREPRGRRAQSAGQRA